MDGECLFCDMDEDHIIEQYRDWYVVRDLFPVNRGHTLIVLNDHRRSISELSEWPWEELRDILNDQMARLREETGCTDFNIGINDGRAAGQTVPHGHVHVIPRHQGDSPDPRGGIRWIKPEKARYWGEGEK